MIVQCGKLKKIFRGSAPNPAVLDKGSSKMDKVYDSISLLVMASLFYLVWLITP